MTQKIGRCKSYGFCNNADSRKDILADDTNFKCPECGKPLTAAQGESQKPFLSRQIMIGAAIFAVVGTAIYFGTGGKQEPLPRVQKPLAEWINEFHLDR